MWTEAARKQHAPRKGRYRHQAQRGCRYDRIAACVEAIPASVQDRDGAAELIKKTRRLFPFVKHVFADGGYSGDNLATDLAAQQVTLKIVKRMDKEGGFKVIRRRWVVERTFSRLRRNRRLMAHYEAIAIIAEGFAKLAMISVTLKRLTEPRPKPAS